jgi:hypothetical protein
VIATRVTGAEQPGAHALTRGAPTGPVTLPPLPRQVAGPQPATPAAITGPADNGIPDVALHAYRVAATRSGPLVPDDDEPPTA